MGGVAVAVAVGVLVAVAVAVGVFVGVLVGVRGGVNVGVKVGVLVGVRVGVNVGVDVGVLVAVAVAVGVFVGTIVGVAVGPPPVIVKFTSETSKKIFPTPCILIRAVELGVFGIVTFSVPSFAVLAKTVIGNVVPPSVDSVIETLAALTGALVVFATFHVTVYVEFAG